MKENGPKPRHRVYALVDEAGQVIYIGVAAAGRASWEVTWDHRENTDSVLSRLLRTLERKPAEITLLGSVGLHTKTAFQAAGVLGAWFPGAVVEGLTPGGGRHGRAVSRVKAGRIETWPSRTAAAKAVGVSRRTIIRWLHAGGCWIDGADRDH